MSKPNPPHSWSEAVDEILARHRSETWSTGWNNDATEKAKAALDQAFKQTVETAKPEKYDAYVGFAEWQKSHNNAVDQYQANILKEIDKEQ